MKSKTFNLTFTATIAASLSACGPTPSGQWDDGYTQYADQDTAVCVDPKTNKRIDDDYCEKGGRRHGGGVALYYVGRNSALPYRGDSVSGGSYRRASGVSYYRAPSSTSITRSAAVSRGGFGSTGRSFSFGGSS